MEFLILFLGCLGLLYGGLLYLGRPRAKTIERESVRPFSYREARKVRDRTRRGPEAESHLGKTKIGGR